MNQIQEKIEEGKRLLNTNLFPGEIIESVKNTHARKSIRTEIFHFDIPFQKATASQKEWRSKLLVVQLVHTKYLSAKDKYRATAVILFMAGFITFVTAYTRMNDNINFGISSMLIGVLIYTFSILEKWTFDNIGLISLVLIVLTLLEFITLGWPHTYMEFMYDSPHFGAAMHSQQTGGVMTVMLNESTPFIYLAAKLMTIYLILNIYWKQRIYLKEKFSFEQKA